MMITRNYQKESFSKIIQDVFRLTNHVLVWNYSNKRIASVDVWISDGGTNEALYTQIPSSKKSLPEKKWETNRNRIRGHIESENRETGCTIPGIPYEPDMPEFLFHPEDFE